MTKVDFNEWTNRKRSAKNEGKTNKFVILLVRSLAYACSVSRNVFGVCFGYVLFLGV